MSKLLLHVCCGPCTIYPLSALKEKGFEITAFFYNPNIHPYQEYKRRIETFYQFAKTENLSTITCREDYLPEDFLRQVIYREERRCAFCYAMRLEETAKIAKKGNFPYFSTTLLVSPYQKHELIKEIGEEMGRKYGVEFYYEDFRTGWKEGVEKCRELELYRQPYCGCIYSEKDRYYKKGKGERCKA